MRIVRSALGLLALTSAVAGGCGSPELNHDDFATRHHMDQRTQAMVAQAERALDAGDAGMAAQYLQQIAESLADDASGQLALARTLIAKAKFQEANEILAKLAESYPDDPEVDLVIGTLAEARGRWEMARVAYARAVDKAPEHISAVLLQARVELVLGEPQRAAALLERKIAIMPGVRELQQALGESYLAAGDYVLAMDWYALALDHDPHDQDLRMRFALAQSLAGAHIDALRTAEGLDPAKFPPYGQLALGRSALLVAEGREAAVWLNQYLESFPEDSGAWIDLARAYLLADADGHAFTALREGLQLDPGRADGLVLLGHIRLRNKQDALALESYLEAMRLGADAKELAPVLQELMLRSGGQSDLESSTLSPALRALQAVAGSASSGGA